MIKKFVCLEGIRFRNGFPPVKHLYKWSLYGPSGEKIFTFADDTTNFAYSQNTSIITGNLDRVAFASFELFPNKFMKLD